MNVITANQLDPTRTLTLRRRFSAAMRRRFNRLERDARAFIRRNQTGLAAGFLFADAFIPFLERQEEIILFENQGEAERLDWMKPFVVGAIFAGARHADLSVSRVPRFANIVLPELSPLNFENEIDFILRQNFTLLSGVTEEMNRQIKDFLIRGIGEGLNPNEIGDLIGNRIKKIGRTRGVVIARTETIRAHAESSLNRFQVYGVRAVQGQVEFRTARDSRVCPICENLDTDIFTIEEARGVIPVHPRCRCVWLPVLE